VPNRAATTCVVVAILTAATVAIWANRANLGHAAQRLGRPKAAGSSTAPVPTRSAAPLRVVTQPPVPLLRPGKVEVPVQGFMSWALLDRSTGTVTGSPNAITDTNSTESMIKAWISSDYLRRLGDSRPSEYRLAELSRMIRDSDDDAAEDIYDIDGHNAVVQRMISLCGLTHTSIVSFWWSRTQVSAEDAVRLGDCIADGAAAGPRWTGWILNEMRQVRGEGRFGIIEALPADVAARTSIKNGWTVVGNEWHLNCLAVVDDYVLAVLTRYPAALGLSYGAGVCRDVAARLQPPR
jgi:hypothetical protein